MPDAELIAYDWSFWTGYLLPTLWPQADRIRAECDHSSADIVRVLPAQPRGLTFVFHVDLTDSSLLPKFRQALCRELSTLGVRVVNGRLTDISKRTTQLLCRELGLNVTSALPDGAPDELLIIKTNRNYGGLPETRVPPDVRIRLGIRDRVVSLAADHGYFITPRNRIERDVWLDPDLVIEKYVDNSDKWFYRAYISGELCALSEAREDAAIKRMDRSTDRTTHFFTRSNRRLRRDLIAAADAFLRLADGIGMNYGCIDMVRDDAGRFFPIDVNATPHWGTEREPGLLEHLRAGLGTF